MCKISLPLVQYVLLASMRDKLIISMVIAMMVGAALSLFMGGAAVIEQDIFSVIFTAASLRIISVLGICLFIVFFVRRSFDNKDIEFLLSRPISRINLVLSYSIALMLIAFLVCVASFLVVYCVAPYLFKMSYLIWGVSFLLEMLIMANIALFFSMFIKSAPSAMIVISGFYVLCRMMGQILGIIDGLSLHGVFAYFSYVMEFISSVMPRLDLLAQTSWLVYGIGEDFSLLYVFLQSVFFSLLVLCAASIDFMRKDF